MEIKPFLGAAADPSELRQRYTLYASDRRTVFPGFPIHTYEQYEANARRASSSAAGGPGGPVGPGGPASWSAWSGERLVGSASVSVVDHDGTAVAVPRVEVAPQWRRRGVGTALLRRVVASARDRGCATLAADAVRVGSDGCVWAERVGFRTVQVFSWQIVRVREVDPARWQVPVPAGFRLEHWTNAAPEPLVAAFAEARNAIADSPLGDSSLSHPTWTVERVRHAEAETAAVGDQSRCVVAVHEESGDVAAFTELLVDPARTSLCWQRDTAVVRAHRGRGLGRAVKAAMLRRLAAEVPGLDRVVTSTAAQNVSMRRVNEQVGYTPYAEIGMLEAELAQIEAALSIPGPRRSS
jgi:GNAT superfamily N-acetyltransferase